MSCAVCETCVNCTAYTKFEKEMVDLYDDDYECGSDYIGSTDVGYGSRINVTNCDVSAH